MPKPRHMGKTSNGFTIVELLIVVVVIAILAAITIVAYNGISRNAKESAVKSTVSQAAKKIEVYKTLNNGTYPPNLDTLGLNSSSDAQYQYSVTDVGYCITSTKSGSAAYVANAYSYGDGDSRTGSNATSGACPGHSTSGGVIIKNLVTNSSFEANTNGWGSSGANITQSTDWANSGSRSLRVTNAGTTNSGDARISSSASTMPFGMEPGKTYTVSARLNFSVAPTGGLGRAPGILFWYSVNGTNWIEDFGPKPPTAPGTYTVSHTITLPANTQGVLIGLGAASSTSGQSFYYDSVIVTEGPTVYAPADGFSPNWIWTGASNNSASTGPAL